jgi:hypothetical protein
VFVGAHHAFRPDSPTMRAVDEGFAEIRPLVVILEGFPTAMGENPPPLIAEVRRYGTAGADEYVRGEGAYAGSIALAKSIPFIGGEPTLEEQTQVLKSVLSPGEKRVQRPTALATFASFPPRSTAGTTGMTTPRLYHQGKRGQ